jgi:hypothetical protein
MRPRIWLAAVVVLVPLLGYPLVTLAGGAPRFPTRAECARAASAGADDVQVVYGRLDDVVLAEDLLARLTSVGFVGAEIELDDCGRWKVAYGAVDSFEQAGALAEQARANGFDARVELER